MNEELIAIITEEIIRQLGVKTDEAHIASDKDTDKSIEALKPPAFELS